MNDDRITALAQDIYLARHNQQNGATGSDLLAFQDETISWVNQLIPEVEMARDPAEVAVDWNFLRTSNDPTLGTVTSANTIAYPLPGTVRRLVASPHRDLTIQQDGTVVSTFKVVNPNQILDPNDADVRDRAMVVQRNIIFSRPLNQNELSGTIVADTIAYMPQLSHTDVSLLDILDAYPNIRQLFVYGVLKNQILPDIVQGGLTPSFSQRFDDYLANCIAENNLSAVSDDSDYEDFGWVGGVSF